MDLYFKSIIGVLVLILILLNTSNIQLNYKYKFGKNNSIEYFDNHVDSTIINGFSPKKGDSSTIITMTGIGLQYIGRIYFRVNEIYAECILFNEDRTNKKIMISPPPLSELGLNINDVRRKMNENQNKGYPIEGVYMIRQKDINKELLSKKKYTGMPLDSKDYYKLPGVKFSYIDKMGIKPVCNEKEKPPIETPEINFDDTIPGEDMKFFLVEIDKKKKNIGNLINSQQELISDLNNLSNDNYYHNLKNIHDLKTLEDINKEFNIQRYNIQKFIKNNY